MTLRKRLEQSIRTIPDFPQPGIQFKDITPVLLDAALVRDCARALADPYRQAAVQCVLGIESRGFLLGPLIAQELDCGFAIVRKKGKLPSDTIAVSYELEYGSATIELHRDALRPGDKVLIHDDLLATGGTATAAAELVNKLAASVVGFCFMVSLNFLPGKQRLSRIGAPITELIDFN